MTEDPARSEPGGVWLAGAEKAFLVEVQNLLWEQSSSMWQEEEVQGLILVWSLPASFSPGASSGHSLCLHLCVWIPQSASSRPK